MDVKQMFSVWRRRWVLTIALLLLALVGTAAATQVLPKYYQAQSTVTLLPSPAFSSTNGDNPYLSFDGSLPVTAQLISFQLMDPRTVQALANEGYSATYTNALDANSTGPVLQTVVVGHNKALVESTLTAVTNEIGTELASLQSGIVKAKDKITVETLSFDPKPTLEITKTARPIVVVLFLGIVLALAIPLIVDGQLGRSQKLARSRKQPARRAVRATVPGVPGPRTPASSASSAASVSQARLEQAARPVTPSAKPDWAAKPAEPDWAGKPAEPDWDAKPADPQWLPSTPASRPESAAKAEWPAAPVPPTRAEPARTEWPAAPVPPPSRPEWMGTPATPSAERNGADTPAQPEWPAKPATSLFEPDRDAGEPAKPASPRFEPDREEPAKPASSRFRRDDDEQATPASSRFHRDEPAKPASSRFHRDDDQPAKPAAPMPWDEDHAEDTSPAAGGGQDSKGQNGSAKDHHDREAVPVRAGHTGTDDPDDDGPATQPQERVT